MVVSALVGIAGAFADLAVPTPTLSVPQGAKILGVKVPPFHVDDNFVVPLFTAFCVVRVFEALQLPGLKLASVIPLFWGAGDAVRASEGGEGAAVGEVKGEGEVAGEKKGKAA